MAYVLAVLVVYLAVDSVINYKTRGLLYDLSERIYRLEEQQSAVNEMPQKPRTMWGPLNSR